MVYTFPNFLQNLRILEIDSSIILDISGISSFLASVILLRMKNSDNIDKTSK